MCSCPRMSVPPSRDKGARSGWTLGRDKWAGYTVAEFAMHYFWDQQNEFGLYNRWGCYDMGAV